MYLRLSSALALFAATNAVSLHTTTEIERPGWLDRIFPNGGENVKEAL